MHSYDVLYFPVPFSKAKQTQFMIFLELKFLGCIISSSCRIFWRSRWRQEPQTAEEESHRSVSLSWTPGRKTWNTHCQIFIGGQNWSHLQDDWQHKNLADYVSKDRIFFISSKNKVHVMVQKLKQDKKSGISKFTISIRHIQDFRNGKSVDLRLHFCSEGDRSFLHRSCQISLEWI